MKTQPYGLFYLLSISLLLVGLPTASSAAERSSTLNVQAKSASDSLQLNESETQLAKRFELRESQPSSFEYSLGAGIRQDNLSWSIASPSINVASEVNWKNTNLSQIRGAAKFNFWDDWQVRGQLSTAAVKSGTNQDSDYAASNRTQEFLRSNNKTGGAMRDMSLGLGRKFQLPVWGKERALLLVPLVGFSIHQQGLTMIEGQQTLPSNGALLTGLNNSYDTQWQGAWLGMDAAFAVWDAIVLTATLEYHWVNYYAQANWNLRNDLAHPVSFKHTARGHGMVAALGAGYPISRNLQLNLALEQQRWTTDAGYDQTFFASGVTRAYTLNPVNWDSRLLMLTAQYQF